MKITFEFATQDDCLDRMVPSDLRVLVAQRDRLQARVAELVAVAVSVRDDLLLRSEINSDGTRCVNLSASKWSSFWDVIDDNNSGAFITRKQAEAVQASRRAISSCSGIPNSSDPASANKWIKCSEQTPNSGQRVILQSKGVIQNYMPLFGQGDNDFGMNEDFWEFERVNDIDNPLVNFEEDCWMPLPKPPKQEKSHD